MKRTATLLLITLCTTVHAQQWVNCTSGHHVNDVIRDNDIIWTATTGGLVKNSLAGDDPVFFNRGNSPIPSNDVRSLAIDSEGKLWASTNSGTAIYDGTDWQVFYEKCGLVQLDHEGKMIVSEIDSLHWWDGQSFESMALPFTGYFRNTAIEINPSNGDIWLTYYTFGQYAVFRFSNSTFTTFQGQNSILPFGSASSNPLVLDLEQRVWAGTSSGLFRYENEEWVFVNNIITNIPAGEVTSLKLDSEGNIWAGIYSGDGALVKISPDDEIEIHALPIALNAHPRIEDIEILETSEMKILCGSHNYGLWEYDLSDWKKKPTDQSPARSNNITQLFLDGETTYVQAGRNFYFEENSLFSITNGDWLYYDENNFPASLNGDYPPTVVLRNNDTLWVHTGDSLFAYVGNTWSAADLPDIANDVEEINSFIHFEEDGKRWLLERWQSYIFYESDTGWKTFEHQVHGASSGSYDAYFNHPETGDFWLASANGISRYDGQSWHIIKPTDLGLGSNWVYGMEVDENGVVWANTYQAILRIENTIPEIFTTDIPGHEEKSFGKFTFDDQGRLWLGMDNAVAVLEGNDWEVFDNKNSGVPNGRIVEIDFDEWGNLWLGSGDGGFAVYNPDGLPEHFLEDFHSSTSVESTLDKLGNAPLIYPNPLQRNSTMNLIVPDQFQIDGSSNIFIYNPGGQLVFKKEINGRQLKIRLDFIQSAGIYFIQIQNQKETLVQSIIAY